MDEADGVRTGQKPVPGMRLRFICRGHTGAIGRIARSPLRTVHRFIFYGQDYPQLTPQGHSQTQDERLARDQAGRLSSQQSPDRSLCSALPRR